MGVNAGARLDRLPISSFHRRIMWLIGAGMFFDGFNIYIGATVLGAALKSGFSTLGQNAEFVSLTFVGMMLGSFVTGFLGDRRGRRFTYQANLAIFGFASIAAAFAPSMNALIMIQFIIGLGLGAENVVGYSTLTEFVPPQSRGKWLGFMTVFVVTGLPVAALLGTLIVPRFGWRAMFVIGGIGALIVWYLRKALPESPRWLEAVGRNEEADALLLAIEREAWVATFWAARTWRFRRVAKHSRELLWAAQPRDSPAHDCGLGHLGGHQHAAVRLRDLAADFFVQQGLSIALVIQLFTGHGAGRANWIGHWRLHRGLLGTQADHRGRLTGHDSDRRFLSIHHASRNFGDRGILADRSHLCSGCAALRHLYPGTFSHRSALARGGHLQHVRAGGDYFHALQYRGGAFQVARNRRRAPVHDRSFNCSNRGGPHAGRRAETATIGRD